MLVDFCARSPFASSLEVCKARDGKAMVAHLQHYADNEYHNQGVLACLRGDAACPPTVRTRMDNLLLEPETLVPIEHILTYMCHNSGYADELAVCAAKAGLVQWKPSRSIPPAAKDLPGVQAFQAVRRVDVVLLAHCASDASLCPPRLLIQLSELQKHLGMLVLNDAVIVFFCKHSRFAAKLQVCREHHADQLIAHLHTVEKSEYRTKGLLSCVRTGLGQQPTGDDSLADCTPAMRSHLEQLVEKPEMLVAIQHILKFMCHTPVGEHLAVCIDPVTSPRRKALRRLQITKYAVMTSRAQKTLLF